MTSNHLLLYRLTELMLEQEQYILPVDLLFDDEQIGDFVKSIQIDSPYQQMLLEGVLTESVRDEKLFVSFTVEGYFHYVLGEVLATKYANASALELHDILTNNQLKGLHEGLERFLVRKVDQEEFELLFWFIDHGHDFIKSTIEPLSHAFLMANHHTNNTSVSGLAQLLFADSTDNDIKLLSDIIDRLDKMQKRDVLDAFFAEIANFFSPDTPPKAIIYSKAIKSLNAADKAVKMDQLLALDFDLLELDTVNYYQNIGSEMNALGRYNESVEVYKKALSILEQLQTSNVELTAEITNNLGIALQHDGKLDESIEKYMQSIELYTTQFGANHMAISTIYNNLGLAHQDKGLFDKAMNYYESALNSDIRTYGNQHPNTATTYSNIATLYNKQSNYIESKVFNDKALKIFFTIYGENHELTATLYNNMALVELNLKNYTLALEFYHKALAILESVFGEKHPWYAATISNIGGVYQESRDLDNAMKYFVKGLTLKLDVFGEKHPSVGISYNNIAKCYVDQHNIEEAILHYNQALSIFQNALGEEHPHTVMVKNKIKAILA